MSFFNFFLNHMVQKVPKWNFAHILLWKKAKNIRKTPKNIWFSAPWLRTTLLNDPVHSAIWLEMNVGPESNDGAKILVTDTTTTTSLPTAGVAAKVMSLYLLYRTDQIQNYLFLFSRLSENDGINILQINSHIMTINTWQKMINFYVYCWQNKYPNDNYLIIHYIRCI